MPSTHNINLCDNWEAGAGDSVNWQTIPSSCTATSKCTITQDGSNPWPFKEAAPISIPSASNSNTLRTDLSSGTVYYYNVSCCSTRSVTITGK